MAASAEGDPEPNFNFFVYFENTSEWEKANVIHNCGQVGDRTKNKQNRGIHVHVHVMYFELIP